jgi:hypothetical protein
MAQGLGECRAFRHVPRAEPIRVPGGGDATRRASGEKESTPLPAPALPTRCVTGAPCGRREPRPTRAGRPLRSPRSPPADHTAASYGDGAARHAAPEGGHADDRAPPRPRGLTGARRIADRLLGSAAGVPLLRPDRGDGRDHRRGGRPAARRRERPRRDSHHGAREHDRDDHSARALSRFTARRARRRAPREPSGGGPPE